MQTYARPEAIAAKYTKYASEITAKILEFYEGHFELQYGMGDLGKTIAPKFKT